MKKLGLVLALVLVVVVGGVYATWDYASGTVEPVELGNGITLALEADNSDAATPQGTFSFGSSDIALTLDDAGSHVAEIVGTGKVDVNFTGVDGYIVNNPVFVVTVSAHNYDGNTEVISSQETEIAVPNTNAGGNKIGEIAGTDIAAALTPSLTLANQDAYTAFDTWLGQNAITVTVTVKEAA